MVIIGITGGIGHGKSTLAEAFGRVEPRSKHLESFELIAEVVNAWHMRTTAPPNPHELSQVNDWLNLLPEILEQVVHQHVDPATLQFGIGDIGAQPEFYEKLFTHLQNVQKRPDLLTGRLTNINKADYRAILQWLGGYLVVKVDSGIWYKELMRRAAQAAAEGMQLCTIGGLRYPSDADIVHAGGGYILVVHRPLMSEQDLTDPTERERYKIQPDITVVNNAGVQELVTCAQSIYTDIKLGKLQSKYVASDLQQR
jgi:hypothetical protein